ncbi:MAG: hypothetical protein J1G02_04555 [Clostridiales bacterium]|nr:hypothetical protein [Clostridiales bacterium]
MSKRQIRIPFLGLSILSVSWICTLVAFIMSFKVYKIFGYATNRWAVFLSFAALWLITFLMVNSLFAGEKPFWADLLYVAVCVALTFAAILFIQPCLAPMGIYFTVGNMGDVEANAAGVPRAIATVALYIVALLGMLIAAFVPAFIGIRKKDAVSPATNKDEVAL